MAQHQRQHTPQGIRQPDKRLPEPALSQTDSVPYTPEKVWGEKEGGRIAILWDLMQLVLNTIYSTYLTTGTAVSSLLGTTVLETHGVVRQQFFLGSLGKEPSVSSHL